MRTRELWLVGAVVGVVVVVQVSTASMWWTPSAGAPLLIVDALLVVAVILGAAVGRRAFVAGGIAAAATVLSGVACVWFATANGSSGCGSPLSPSDYDCVPIEGTLGVVVTAIVTMGAGGSAMSGLAGAHRVRLRDAALVAPIAVCIALVGGALVIAPRSTPAAPSQTLALAEVTRELHLTVALLVLAVVLAIAGVCAWTDRHHELPWRSALFGVWCAAIAGVAVATVWIAVLADYMKGP